MRVRPPRLALVALVAMKLLTAADVNAWWLLPVAVVLLLGDSLRRAAR